ncbi:MAG: dTDP-4-dehydrorhamnose reductase [Nitrospirales bacterium]|nr:MAG: dTDP-4-dehydrorhamnose reductase [Nitrospirales bacterium]
MKFPKLLITGAKGQLGQALQAQFVDHEVIAWDIQDLDISQLEQVRKAVNQLRPDILINAAAFTQVDQAETHQEAAYRGNALGPRNLALATKEMNIPLVHFSTDYVFDGRQSRPYHEFDRPNPLSVYGQSKLAGEEEVQKGNPRHFVVRTAWLYHIVGKNFPQTILRLANQEEIRVVNGQFGSPTFAPHLAQALSRLLETDAYGTYHLAGSGGASWYDFTKALYQARGIQTSVRPITTAEYPLPAPRPAYAVLTSLQDPSITLPPWEEGVRDFASQWKGQNA